MSKKKLLKTKRITKAHRIALLEDLVERLEKRVIVLESAPKWYVYTEPYTITCSSSASGGEQ